MTALSTLSPFRGLGRSVHRIASRVFPGGESDISTMALIRGVANPGGSGGHKRKNAKSEDMDDSTIQASASRARRRLSDNCLARSVNHLLTLTFRENVTDLDQAWSRFAYFSKLCKKHGHHFQYVAVWERQKRGAIHFHLAVDKRIEYGKAYKNNVRDCWLQACGPLGGNIDVSSQHKAAAKKKDRRALVGYLTKYLAKTFLEEGVFNRRRYSCSRGASIPEPVIQFAPFGADMEKLIADLMKELTGCYPQKIINYDSYFKGYKAFGFLKPEYQNGDFLCKA